MPSNSQIDRGFVNASPRTGGACIYGNPVLHLEAGGSVERVGAS